ncbi:MAG: T9SS type A sorting domain-containing protein [Bacteroidetes bacterium]|nr:T9SS type A sorting domain-containing protein [Bacteroidota bacterium]MBU1113836.1 T9SS type A sorting domain-containing protein [Bacteroidota bacterium]MBU1798206.1 T9SS type A sorting domain-containing protein [Bacteroidota bacterium]
MYTWDFAVAVEISPIEYFIYFTDVTKLVSTLSTEARTVEATIIDSNPGGSESGIAEANLIYTINGGEEISVLMTANGDIYSAQIPGQVPGTEVRYWITASNVYGILGISARSYTYNIIKVNDDNNLVVFNGFTSPNGYPQQYYFGTDNSYTYNGWTYDAWAYGELTKELVDNYQNIFEICTGGPGDYNREVITEWLSADGERNYLLAGEEWLGADNQYEDKDYFIGSFEYDILGITHSYNDISYDGTSGQDLPSRLFPQEGTELGGAMFDKVWELNAVDTVLIDSILYNPMYEIGQASNWFDGFEIIEGDETSEVFMKAETRGIMATPEVREVNVGVSRVLPAGNKIVFMTYDPISIDSSPSYYWFGQGDVSQTTLALFWFGANIVGVDANGTQPETFSLSQNYPNPFNPSTIIKYSIPRSTEYYSVQQVQLKVYDILGREVAMLVNKEQKAGNYEVNFNASKLSSGVYFYKLQAGSFSQTKKLLLLK